MKNPRILAYIVAALVLLLLLLGLLYYWSPFQRTNEVVVPVVKEPVVQQEEKVSPKRTDFVGTKPTGFPEEIPVEQGAVLEQSYSIDYGTQMQYTVTFPTKKTVAQNHAFYSDFFTTNGWAILNTHEEEGNDLAAFYAMRENLQLSVTIISGQVSLTVVSLLPPPGMKVPTPAETEAILPMIKAMQGTDIVPAP